MLYVEMQGAWVRSISRLCVVVLTGATERVDGIVEDSSAKIVSGIAVWYDNIIAVTVATTIVIDESSV